MIKPIFKRGPLHFLQVITMVILSVCLIHFDHMSPTFHQFRQRLATVVLPIQYLVDAPFGAFHWVRQSWHSNHELMAENDTLKVQELLLKAKLQQMLQVEDENNQLKKMLSSVSEIKNRVKIAQLLAISLNDYRQEWLIDAGADSQVYVGQPVIDAYGIVGQVVDTTKETSRILLLTDGHSKIPVRNTRNGLRAIATGLGAGHPMALLNIQAQTDFQVGDILVSSGLGLRYPQGYPVARVVKVRDHASTGVQEVLLAPIAHFKRTRQVLLVWDPRLKHDRLMGKQL